MIDARVNINPYELRLGNWVEDEDDSHLQFQVDHIEQGKDLVSDLVFINGRHHLGILPIPLTPEILKKAGFINIPVADDVSYQQLSHDFIDIYTGDKNGICEVVFAIEDHEIRRVRYVHDLQNVFFALTNQEIKI